jgi:hypothetical protein
MSNAISKILGSGGASGKAAEEPNEFRSFVDSGGGRPQMGFSIARANGDMEGFLYHNLDNLNFQTRNGAEFLSFTHRGKAVTLQGTRLRIIFRAIMRHTLMEINEAGGRTADPALPVISRMEITTVEPGGTVSPVRLAK